MFGDNLSMISDTTIAAVGTQECEMKDKFKAKLLIVLPATIISIVIFAVLTRNSSYIMEGSLDYNIWRKDITVCTGDISWSIDWN